MKRYISLLILSVFLVHAVHDVPHAGLYAYQFEDVYQKPWYKSKAAIYGGIVASAVGVALWTYFTAGTGTAAAAGPITTWIGSAVGSLSVGAGGTALTGIAATNAGLATIGFGSVASGGLGILGGVAILSGAGDLALAIAIKTYVGFQPSNDTRKPLERTIPLPTVVGSSENRKAVEEITELTESQDMEDLKRAGELVARLARRTYASHAYSYTDFDETRFDILTTAVAAFNCGEFSKAQECLDILYANSNPEADGFIKYLQAMLHLADGNTTDAMVSLDSAIDKDKKAIPPYLLLAQAYMDAGNDYQARQVLYKAREDAADDSFAVNYLLAALYFRNKAYDTAIEMYEEALSDISIDSLEGECKMYIAICHHRKGDSKSAYEWYDEALEEVEDDPDNRRYLMKLWEERSIE